MASVLSGNLEKKRKKYGHRCCAAAKCNNRSDNRPELSFHAFPQDPKTGKEWELRMRRGDVSFKSVDRKFCCSEHFLPSDFKDSLTGHRRELKKGSIPSIFDWAPAKVSLREERLKIRTENISRAQTEDAKYSMETKIQECNSPMLLKESLVDCVTEKNFGPPTLDEFVKNLKTEIKNLKEELSKAKEKEYVFKFGLERFASSSEDINFYTGFPDYDTLIVFWQYIEPNAANLTYYSSARDASGIVPNVPFPYFSSIGKKFPGKGVGAQRTLQPVDEFWLFLTRVRLGLFERDLAFRFNISISTVSDIVITWSNYLFVMLGSLPVWPPKEVIKKHLPKVFEGRFENVRCIIDCTEIKCEKPEDLQKQSELYSEYKSHNTFKGLVGVSPNVWMTFVSGLYGGSISDREIVKKSHFIDLLDHNDLIMADRGFEIQDMLAVKQAQLFIPPRRQSVEDQFSKDECFETMRIANLRIHVERAIKRVKGWHIFDQVLPLSMAGVINQVWTVCCLLTNWQKPALTC